MKMRLYFLAAALVILSGCTQKSAALPTAQAAPSAPVLQTEPPEAPAFREEDPGFPPQAQLHTEKTEADSDLPAQESQKDLTPDSSPAEPAESDAAHLQPPEKPAEQQTEQPPAATSPSAEASRPSEPEESVPEKPAATEPAATAPAGTEPAAEKIDPALLEAHARSYAGRTYGYEGDAALGFENAGYFPGVRITIETMADGYAAAERAVDDQYQSDLSMGYPVVEIIDGVACRAKINVYFEPTDDPNAFVLWCFYG